MEKVSQENIREKKIVLRLDLNVPIKNEVILDDSKIQRCIPMIKFLLDKNCKVIILSHLGRIKKEEDKKNLSLKPVASRLNEILKINVSFSNELKLNPDTVFDNSKLVLHENTRFYDVNSLESSNDESLAKYFASLGEVFINDAFATSHRKHASNYGITKYIPSYYGLLIDEELKNLDAVINVKKRPFLVFMGGAKVDDKILLIKKMLEKCDYLIPGGGILNSFLKSLNYDIKDSLATTDDKILKDLKKIYYDNQHKIKLCTDLLWDNNAIVDIDLTSFTKLLNEAKQIFINGTPGIYENPKYSLGTRQFFDILKNSKSNKIVGGGDAVAAIKLFKQEKNVDYISTGGGASLTYINNGYLESLK